MGAFYSAGHKRRQIIWNWPTVGDHIHVQGLLNWDRGHPPAATEIHPPRLVAITRHLPAVVERCLSDRLRLSSLMSTLRDLETAPPRFRSDQVPQLCERRLEQIQEWHQRHDREIEEIEQRLRLQECHGSVLATRVDVFASGDGGALWNNRQLHEFVMPVSMADRDYRFNVTNKIEKPHPNAKLKWHVEVRPGDSFGVQPEIIPDGEQGIRINIPWGSRNIDKRAILARTIYIFWDVELDELKLDAWNKFKVILDKLVIRKTHDASPQRDGEYRIFAEVAGNWVFLNDFAEAANVIKGGLGDSEENKTVELDLVFTVYVPPGHQFRVHASGWEADGADLLFGDLHNPRAPCTESLKDWLNTHLFNEDAYLSGCLDDPTGEINSFYSEGNQFGNRLLNHVDPSKAPGPDPYKIVKDPCGDTFQFGSFQLYYRTEELRQ
jgi:hypothetical protein